MCLQLEIDHSDPSCFFVAEIIISHIVPNKLFCDDLKKQKTVKNIEGSILTIIPSDGNTYFHDLCMMY